VALDEELHREVALKQILDQHADDPTSRHRFVIEAEVTGGLEHPGVVPVYGLGNYKDGRPYYAMRLIRGESLKDAVERFHREHGQNGDAGVCSLGLRGLLRRFVDVCNAVHYAHARGVLHRDLKPSNIVLGKHGETLVVDWGLAKATGRSDPIEAERALEPMSTASGSAETLPGSALGTPAYMSPEQAAGQLDQLGPASDVYSLGATLYFLLTGQPPFAGDAVEVLPLVQKGEFPRPHEVDASIDGALEAVCLKSLALRPEERYGSAKALADDIERWMADEPVTAWHEPFSRRARRWARRNRTAVATVGAAVLVALAGTAGVLAIQTRSNRDLRAANRRTLNERDFARRNADLARRNYRRARGAVDDYLTRVADDSLLKEGGLHELRRDLLEAALRYYDEFLREWHNDPSLTAEAAAAQERVGDIRIELGRPRDALAAYNEAVRLVEPLIRERPSDRAIATARVRLEAQRLQAMKELADPDAAATFERVKHLGEALLASGGGTQELPVFLARTYIARGLVLRNDGRIDEALAIGLRAHDLCEQATRAATDDIAAARARLYAAAIVIELLCHKGRMGDARRLCEQERAFGEAGIRVHPRDVELRTRVALSEQQLAEIEQFDRDLVRALALARHCAQTLGALARENPQLVRVRSQWGVSLWLQSTIEVDLGQLTDAERSARAAIEANDACVRDVPSYAYYRMAVGMSYGSLGKTLVMRGQVVEGLAALRKALAILESIDNPNGQYGAVCYLALAAAVDDPADGSAASDRQLRDKDHAMAILRRLLARGFANTALLKNDPDLDTIRSRPDFQALLLDLEFPQRPFAP
jgi:serine/threonine-protein kinase